MRVCVCNLVYLGGAGVGMIEGRRRREDFGERLRARNTGKTTCLPANSCQIVWPLFIRKKIVDSPEFYGQKSRRQVFASLRVVRSAESGFLLCTSVSAYFPCAAIPAVSVGKFVYDCECRGDDRGHRSSCCRSTNLTLDEHLFVNCFSSSGIEKDFANHSLPPIIVGPRRGIISPSRRHLQECEECV